jgi:hypothetical protein
MDLRPTIDLLNELAEFLASQADTKDGDDGHPEPNRAMGLQGEVETEIERLRIKHEEPERLFGQFALLAAKAGWKPESIQKIADLQDQCIPLLLARKPARSTHDILDEAIKLLEATSCQAEADNLKICKAKYVPKVPVT